MKRVRDKDYMSYVRGHGCLICGGQSSAHHMRLVEDRAMAMKVGDNWCVPLCHACHMQLHDFGNEELWWGLKGVDPIRWAEKHWKLWTTLKDTR